MEPPEKPNPDDCCNSGCNPCILDVYEDQLRLYEKKLTLDNRNDDNKHSCISPTKLSVFKVVDITRHTSNTFLYTFEFLKFSGVEDKIYNDYVVKFEPGQHFFLRGTYLKEDFSRAYTPLFVVNSNEKQFKVIIKLYEHGEMSSFLKRLRLGQHTLWRGPYGDYNFSYMHKNILFIAQGTGIAPFHSIIQKLLDNEDCCTFLKLFYCCHSCTDILLREDLQGFSQHWNFTYELFLSDTNNLDKKYNEIMHLFKLNEDYLEEYIKNKTTLDSLQILICGTETFTQQIKNVLLINAHCDPDTVITF